MIKGEIKVGDFIKIKSPDFFEEYAKQHPELPLGSKFCCQKGRAGEVAIVVKVDREPDTGEPYVVPMGMFGMHYPLEFVEGPLEKEDIKDERFLLAMDGKAHWQRMPTQLKNFFFTWYLIAKSYDYGMLCGTEESRWFEMMFSKENLKEFWDKQIDILK